MYNNVNNVFLSSNSRFVNGNDSLFSSVGLDYSNAVDSRYHNADEFVAKDLNYWRKIWYSKTSEAAYERAQELDQYIINLNNEINYFNNQIEKHEKTYSEQSNALSEKIDRATKTLRAYWQIKNPIEEQIMTAELLENVLDDLELEWDKLIERWEGEIAYNEAELQQRIAALQISEAEIKAIEDEHHFVRISRDIQRTVKLWVDNYKARRAIRREYREKKRAMKKRLREEYGRGADYREAKKREKAKLKEEKKEALKEYGGSFGRRVLRVFPVSVSMRNSFLLLVQFNVFGLATKMNDVYVGKDSSPEIEDAWKKLDDMWFGFGGSVDSLVANIQRGKDKPIIMSGYERHYYPTGVEEAVVVEKVAESTPIIVKVGKILQIVSSSIGALKELNSLLPAMEADAPAALKNDIEQNEQLTETEKQELLDEMYEPIVPVWALVSGGLLVVGGIVASIYLITSKKK